MAPRRQKFRASVYLITKPIFNILIQYAGICLKFQWIFYFMYLWDPNCWIWSLFLPISLTLFIEILSKNYPYYLAKFSKFTIPILIYSVQNNPIWFPFVGIIVLNWFKGIFSCKYMFGIAKMATFSTILMKILSRRG